MQIIFPIVLMVFFVFAMLLMVIGIANFAGFLDQENNNGIVKSIKTAFFTKLGNDLSMLKVFVCSVILSSFIFLAMFILAATK